MEIISRKEAIEKGLKRYFTGKPCIHGHIDQRFTASSACLTCRLAETRNNIKAAKELKITKLPDEIQKRIISRKDALQNGLNKYFTGFPCSKGHLSERRTSNHSCIACGLERVRAYRKTDEGKARARKDAKKRWADPKEKEKQINSYKAWKVENPDKIKELKKRDYDKHREQYLQKHYAYERKRYKEDPIYRLRLNLPKQIRHALRAQKNRKDNSTEKYVGCKISELKKHIENQFTEGMTWDKYSKDGWHIDHVRPCASFDLKEKSQINICFNWRNLQPLWSLENTVKKDKYTKQDEKLWIERMKDLGFEGELFLKYQMQL